MQLRELSGFKMLASVFSMVYFSPIFFDCSSPEQKDKWLSLLQRYFSAHILLMLITCGETKHVTTEMDPDDAPSSL